MVITVRRLQDSDLNDIIGISRNIWEGHDYLPSVAETWLHDPRSHFYGVETDDRVVAVGNLRLVEDGRTGWMEGLRVHPQYRDKGYANEITRQLIREAEHLRVQRLRYTTSTMNAASLKIAEMAGFSKVLTMAVTWHDNPKPVSKARGDYPSIKKRSPRRTWSLLETDLHIVPHRVLIYDWQALDCSCRNLEEIGKTHEFFPSVNKRTADSMSIGQARQTPNRQSWSFTAYATDSKGFLAQLSHNISTASKHGLSMIACTFETKFEKTLNQTVIGKEKHEETHLVLLEKLMHLKNSDFKRTSLRKPNVTHNENALSRKRLQK